MGTTNGGVEAAEIDYEYIPTTNNHVNMLAGAIAGIAEHCLIYPLDLIKTRMQSQFTHKSHINAPIITAIRTSPTSLWRGVTSLILGAGPSHALYFGTYEFSKSALPKYIDISPTIVYATSGGCATIVSDAFLNPFDVVKQRMQIIGSPYRNIFDCASSIFRNEGIKAFYISYPATLSMTVPFHLVQFATYESVSQTLNPEKKYNPATYVLSGGIAGGLAAIVTNPLDVVKTTLQTKRLDANTILEDSEAKIISVAKKIYGRYGIGGFFRGVKPRVISIFPSTSICWATYEFFKIYLNFAGS